MRFGQVISRAAGKWCYWMDSQRNPVRLSGGWDCVSVKTETCLSVVDQSDLDRVVKDPKLALLCSFYDW